MCYPQETDILLRILATLMTKLGIIGVSREKFRFCKNTSKVPQPCTMSGQNGGHMNRNSYSGILN
jgi:hypothetical protein